MTDFGNIDALLKTLPQHNVQPLWTVMNAVVPPAPNPKAVPHIWKYKQIKPLLMAAGRFVSDREAERRVLQLINPALKAPYTTDTLYAGLQLIQPGETATAHRHVAFALRFIIEGDRGFTAVEGQKVYMGRGDVILTPSWHWHDHGHEGGAPMIWLDGLDLPMYQAIPVNFAQGYKEHRYPSLETPESMHKLPWKTVHCALASIPGPYARYQYLLPSGKPLSLIIGAEAERIDARMEAPRRRETASFVYHVVEGTGRTVFDDGEVILWEKSDTFCIPAWKAHYHVNDCDETVYLFSFSDRPLLENLGMFRREEGAHNVDGSV